MFTPTFFINRSIDSEVKEEITNRLLSHANAFALFLSSNSKLSLIEAADSYANATNLRITLISLDGQVLGESGLSSNEVMKMDNHLSRPEVLQASREAFGVATRYSSTLKEEYIYVALKINAEKASFIRVAQTMDFAKSLISLR